ncbi:MAG: hypothetical protein LCH38_10995 [Proteobacteria bacterium]|nr:hypothetical protein [Pseudomonadota bacterium]
MKNKAASFRDAIKRCQFNADDPSDIAAEACRQAVLEAAAKALSWPQGDNPVAHFAGAYVALWQIAIASYGVEGAEPLMRELWDWSREFAMEIST